MESKQVALAKIVEIARDNNLSTKEIVSALQQQDTTSEVLFQKKKMDFTMKLFSYLGSIFILSGISIYIGMFWSQLNSPARIIITLGPGLIAYIMAVIMEKNPNYSKMITPLFLLAALFIPTGLFVAIHEYSTGGDPHKAGLLVFGIMFIQQLLTFWNIPRTVLVFTSIFFAAAFYCTALDDMSVASN